MVLLTKDLLINFLFILLPLSLLQLLYLLKYTYRFKELEEWMFSFFPILSVALCMLFPASVESGFIWDLRWIPLILGMLYGGPGLSVFLLSMILTTRYFTGGDGVYISLLSYSLLFFAVTLLSKHYRQMSLKSKVSVSCSLTFLSIMLSAILTVQFISSETSSIAWVTFITVNVIGMLITTLLWETIRTNFDMLQKLMKAEKIEIVSHLAASISHEVRNPLTVSRGFLQLLADESIDAETRKRYIDMSIEELDRAADIINDYLTFAKPAFDKPENIHVLADLQHIIQVMTPLANMNGVQIRFDFSQSSEDCTRGDRKKFQQSLINIIKNAIESMQKGGELFICLRSFHSNILITIHDEGKGMTQEQINRLGEPYFTMKETGTGLGTMISFSIIQAMGGTIQVESEHGKGTCFSIHLPIIESK